MTTQNIQQNETRLPLKLQSLILYIINALIVSYSAYADASSRVEMGKDISYTVIAPFLLSSILFLGAAIWSLKNPRFAGYIALAAILIAGVSYGLFICGILYLDFFHLFTPDSLTRIMWPCLMLYFTASYAYWISTKAEEPAGPLRWFFSNQSKLPTKIVVILSLIACGSIAALNQASTRTVTREMRWQPTRPYDSPCRQRVELSFVEAHGYRIEACSDDMLEYLESTNRQTVSVTFEVSFSLGVPVNYEIKQVGQWQGQLEERPSSYFLCSSTDPPCYGPQPGSPLSWKE